MSARPFAEVLDTCLAQVASGERSVEQCVAEWPEYAEQLGAMLRAASALGGLRLPVAAPDPLRRAQLMALLRSTPQERPRARGESLAAALRHGVAALGRIGAVAAPAAAVAVTALVLTLGRGGSDAAASTLTIFQGSVERVRGERWAALPDQALIEEGDRLRTDAAGRAVLTFADGTTVSLDPYTEVAMERSRLNGKREIALRHLSGRLWNDVAADERAGSSYTIHTPDATVVAHGTVFETAVTGGETAVTTAEGLVEVMAGSQRLLVAAGETASAHPKGVRPAAAARVREALRLSVDAPFVASLLAPDGRATGALPDGITYQQIAGAFSTHPGLGTQEIALDRAEEGVYTLLLRRVGDGAGAIALRVAGQERRIPVDSAASLVAVRLRVAAVNDQLLITPEAVVPIDDPTKLERLERLIITERARQRAIAIAKQGRQPGEATPGTGTTPALSPSAPPPTRPPGFVPTLAPARPALTPAQPATTPAPPPTRPPTLAPTKLPERTPTPTPAKAPALEPTREPTAAPTTAPALTPRTDAVR